MNYSLGCAFSFSDILTNFQFKQLQFTCNDCLKITGDPHRDILVRKIFLFHLKQVLLDIILNNVTFYLPLSGGKVCNIHMRAVRGETFKRLRQKGKWKDINIISSMFTGFELGFYMLGKRTPRIKSIYLNKELRDMISKNTNEGVAYGDGKNDTTVYNYLEQVYKQFPTISKHDIDRILKFCWKSIYLHNSYGGDVLLTDKEIWCYMGNLKKSPLSHFYYYIRKLTVKLRVLYKRKKIQWDGYYYFALTDNQYLKYLAQKNKRGRPKKNFNFGAVCLYLIYDECRINEHQHKYIFRVPFISKIKLKFVTQELVTDKAELITIREPLKFKDILTYENDYEFL